jgi:hypothetical protein
MKLLTLIFVIVSIVNSAAVLAQDVIAAPKLKGILWNSVDEGLEYHVFIRFSNKLEKGNLARLVSAYERDMMNYELEGGAAYLGHLAFSISSPTPIFLNVDTGEIISESGQVVGVSHFQRPTPYYSEGFEFQTGKISINERTYKIVINP